MIQLEGLGRLDRELADRLWSMQSQEEILAWTGTLPRRLRQRVEVLTALMVWALIDEHVEETGSVQDAEIVLANFRGR
jgi:hypothetical protein